MWVGVEPLLSLFVLSLPVIWLIDWRLSSNSSSLNPTKFLSLFLFFLLLLIVSQAVLGHLDSPSHYYAVNWGISDSLLIGIQHFSTGPEGRLILVAFFYWIYVLIRHKSKILPVTVFSLPLIPLIAIGASAGSFEPVSQTIVSPFSPSPTLYPFFISLITGILLGEAMIQALPMFLEKEISFLKARFVIILWVLVILVVSFKDSISSLSPSDSALSFIFFSSLMIVADIIGGVSETFPESKGETWASLAFTFVLIAISLILINSFSEGISLFGIGLISILSVLGSQIPSLGFDKRNRSAHRWSIFGMGLASLLLITFESLDTISIQFLSATILLIPISWNRVDRYSRSNELR